jgi:hypothetical protein
VRREIRARPVDHDAFAGFADPVEQFEERADLSARAGEDAHLGANRWDRREQRRRDQSCLHYRQTHARFPMPKLMI